eukprot:gene13304-17942_t
MTRLERAERVRNLHRSSPIRGAQRLEILDVSLDAGGTASVSGLINRVATLFKGFLRPRLFRYAKGMEDKMTALSNATAFRLARPLRQQTSVIFSSPHSGRDYPQAFLDASPLVPLALRSSEDAYVDRLFARAPLFG